VFITFSCVAAAANLAKQSRSG